MSKLTVPKRRTSRRRSDNGTLRFAKTLIARQQWRLLGLLATSLMALLCYAVAGGKFTLQVAHDMLSLLPAVVFLGLPLAFLFRITIRRLALATHAPGYLATAMGIVFTIVALIGLVYVIPKKIGVMSLPLGLMGGITGALEAKDLARQRRTRSLDMGGGDESSRTL